MSARLRLLAATDLSLDAARVADRAAAIAAASEGSLELVHVTRYSDLDPFEGLVRAMPRHTCDLARQEAEAMLDALAAALCRRHGIAVATCMADGSLLPAINERAARSAADLVVVGAGGSGGPGAAVSASATQRLVDGLASPVLVVGRQPAAGYRRMLVAVDRPTEPVESLQLASQLAPGAELVVQGMRARSVLEQEARHACDLVVLLRQDAGPLERALPAPVMRWLLTGAGPDVLIVHAPHVRRVGAEAQAAPPAWTRNAH